MAGAKETPRQKMIGLMYLVLLAMLALQVSSAVILKFEQLNRNLEESNTDIQQSNKSKLNSIKAEISKRQDPESQEALLNNAVEIRTKTEKMVAYIESLKQELIDKTGGFDEEGNLKGAKEETVVETVMIGPNKNGGAYTLKTELDDYVQWMNTTSENQFPLLALDAKDHPFFQHKEDQKMKDFAQLNFAQSPMVASLATLSELERDVLNMERKTLEGIASELNMKIFKVKSLYPIVKTNSNYVVAGQTYNAELFLTAQLATEKPKMWMGNDTLSVNDAGIGNISFKAGASDFGTDGIAKKTWTGKINVIKPNGKDTTYEVTQEYFVAKPTLLIQSGSVPNLYRNCGNELMVNVPELGAEYDPSFNVTGGRVIRGAQRNKITIVPNRPRVNLKVNSNGIYIGQQEYKVLPIPLPTIEVKVRGQEVNPVTGIPLEQIRHLKLLVTPDPGFKDFLPRDARYRVTKWTASLASGIRETKTESGSGDLELSRRFLQEAKSGQQLIIKIDELKRMNFRGEKEDVPLKETSRYIKISIN